MSLPNDDELEKNQKRIAWVLAHPGVSPWLKEALQAARERDPVDVLNELEILSLLLRSECNARIRATLPDSISGRGHSTLWKKP